MGAQHRTARLDGQRGASAVEFALILPVLVVIVFGIIYFSLFLNATQGAQAAAREGARVASLRGSTASAACTAATDALSGVSVDTGTATIGVGSASPATAGACSAAVYPCSTGLGNVYVTVRAQVTFSIPFLPNGVGPKNITSTARFRCE